MQTSNATFRSISQQNLNNSDVNLQTLNLHCQMLEYGKLPTIRVIFLLRLQNKLGKGFCKYYLQEKDF
jgi:hypothetical protein